MSATEQFPIPSTRYREFEKRFKVLVRRAGKLNLAPPTYKRLSSVWKEYHRVRDTWGNLHWVAGPGHTTIKLEFYIVEVSIEPVQIEGWEFVGSVEHLGQDENQVYLNLVHSFVDGYKPELEFRTCEPSCDHCGYKRKRNNTYLLREVENNPERLVIRVGKTCLQDFLGTHCPEKVAKMAQTLNDIRRLCDYGEFQGFREAQPPPFYDVEWILRVAAGVIRDPNGNGSWQYRRAAEEDSTVSEVKVWIAKYLYGNPKDFAEAMAFFNERVEHEATSELAAKVKSWIPTLTGNSDYVYSLQLLDRIGEVAYKKIGLIASAVGVYLKNEEKALQRQAKAKVASASTYIGRPGDKIGRKLSKKDKLKGAAQLSSFYVKCIGAREMETDFGLTTLYTFIDIKGNILKWFASGSGHSIKLDNKYLIKATIKYHKEYCGSKETYVSRAVLN